MKNLKNALFLYKNEVIWLRKYKTTLATCQTQTRYTMCARTREGINIVWMVDLFNISIGGETTKTPFTDGKLRSRKEEEGGTWPEAAWV